jgi:hypothetical protein
MTGLLSGAPWGTSLLEHPDLTGPFDRIFERCALTPEDVGIDNATSFAHL